MNKIHYKQLGAGEMLGKNQPHTQGYCVIRGIWLWATNIETINLTKKNEIIFIFDNTNYQPRDI
jgi:hypothetical protein